MPFENKISKASPHNLLACGVDVKLLIMLTCNHPKVTGVISLSDILNFLVLRPGGDDPSQPGCTDMFSKVNVFHSRDVYSIYSI